MRAFLMNVFKGRQSSRAEWVQEKRHVVNLGGLEGEDRVSRRQRAEVLGQRSQAGTLGPAGYVSVSSSPQTRVWHLG